MSEQLDNLTQSLITRERSSKLELLIHLLANLSQPLVVCGPDGIGKTTLLDTLQHYKADLWQYCLIKGHANLSFEEVLKQLGRVLQPGKTELDAAQLLAVYSQNQNKKIILMVDDAGLLVPGLITSIIQYAEANTAIRVVFALTHDDMFVISRSDRVIENSHFIELPPLSEAQCGEFLQHLASKPRSQISWDGITDDLIAHIYRETRGIPGKIIAELPVLAKPKRSNPLQWVLTLILVICLLALAVQWLRSERNQIKHLFLDIKTLSKPEQANPGEQVILAPQVPESQVPQPQAAPEIENSGGQTDVPAGAIESFSEADAVEIPESNATEMDSLPADVTGQAQDTPEPEAPAAEPEPAQVEVPPVDASFGSEQTDWLLAQPGSNYSLQLMVLYQLEPVLALQKKYQSIGQEIRYIKRVKYGKERYTVLYGSFASTELANKQKESLPKEFQQAMPRKISTLINELK